MLAKVITLRFKSLLESFDDEPLKEFIKDKEIFSIRDHFFIRNDVPYLALVITYSLSPQPVARYEGAQKKRDESWRDMISEKDLPLFNMLRDWRNEYGKREGLPPYMIFTNRHLASIVATRPQSLTTLAEIEGIGKAKIEKYGKEVLRIISQPSETQSAEPEKEEIDLEPHPSKFEGDNRPVEQVSWEQAKEFCERLTKATGKTYRLPTEAEWEYACRAGTKTAFAFGETVTPDIVNYDGNYPYGSAPKGKYREATIEVGSLGVTNGWGLYDMHGNVWEWCEDWYGEDYYSKSAKEDPRGPSTGSNRVLRGGSWSVVAQFCRSAFRDGHAPDYRNNYLGFRLVRTLR